MSLHLQAYPIARAPASPRASTASRRGRASERPPCYNRAVSTCRRTTSGDCGDDRPPCRRSRARPGPLRALSPSTSRGSASSGGMRFSWRPSSPPWRPCRCCAGGPTDPPRSKRCVDESGPVRGRLRQPLWRASQAHRWWPCSSSSRPCSPLVAARSRPPRVTSVRRDRRRRPGDGCNGALGQRHDHDAAWPACGAYPSVNHSRCSGWRRARYWSGVAPRPSASGVLVLGVAGLTGIVMSMGVVIPAAPWTAWARLASRAGAYLRAGEPPG